ncbi:putative copper homeostasis (lipo)protein LpqS [Nocardia fluminea]
MLLLAALVIVPAADCLLFDGHGRTVDHHVVGATESAPAAAGHEHAVSADGAEQCAAHAIHSPAQALPPGVVYLTLAALILAAATSVFPAVSARTAGTGGVRGPPLRPARPDGRAVLTLHCISRR